MRDKVLEKSRDESEIIDADDTPGLFPTNETYQMGLFVSYHRPPHSSSSSSTTSPYYETSPTSPIIPSSPTSSPTKAHPYEPAFLSAILHEDTLREILRFNHTALIFLGNNELTAKLRALSQDPEYVLLCVKNRVLMQVLVTFWRSWCERRPAGSTPIGDKLLKWGTGEERGNGDVDLDIEEVEFSDVGGLLDSPESGEAEESLMSRSGFDKELGVQCPRFCDDTPVHREATAFGSVHGDARFVGFGSGARRRLEHRARLLGRPAASKKSSRALRVGILEHGGSVAGSDEFLTGCRVLGRSFSKNGHWF